MFPRLLFLLSAVFLFGCATEQRLGESRIQTRRYSNGFHIQHHRDVKVTRSGLAAAAVEAQEQSVQPEPWTIDRFVMESAMDLVETWERTGLSAPSIPEAKRMALLEPRMPKGFNHRTRIELLATEELPEPIAGRHPESVPGFILSLGWALGLVGEAAVSYLEMPFSGVPIALGAVASIVGYILSRKAYRLSLKHPELYPRYRLSRAARFVSFGFLAPIALYVAIVLLLVLLLGGIRIM